jgi:hypothetical protein
VSIASLVAKPNLERVVRLMVPVEERENTYAQTGNAVLRKDDGKFHAIFNTVQANGPDTQAVERVIWTAVLVVRKRLGVVSQPILFVEEQMVQYARPVNVVLIKTGGMCNTSELLCLFLIIKQWRRRRLLSSWVVPTSLFRWLTETMCFV